MVSVITSRDSSNNGHGYPPAKPAGNGDSHATQINRPTTPRSESVYNGSGGKSQGISSVLQRKFHDVLNSVD